MGTIRIFSILWFLFIFFIKWQRWCKVLCLINCNNEKNFFSIFLMARPYYTLKNNNFKKLGLNKYLLGLNKHHWGSINIYPHDHPTLVHTLIPFLPPRFLRFRVRSNLWLTGCKIYPRQPYFIVFTLWKY